MKATSKAGKFRKEQLASGKALTKEEGATTAQCNATELTKKADHLSKGASYGCVVCLSWLSRDYSFESLSVDSDRLEDRVGP